jgi:hypothetical protein
MASGAVPMAVPPQALVNGCCRLVVGDRETGAGRHCGAPRTQMGGRVFSLKFSHFLLLFSCLLNLTTNSRLLILRNLLMGRSVQKNAGVDSTGSRWRGAAAHGPGPLSWQTSTLIDTWQGSSEAQLCVYRRWRIGRGTPLRQCSCLSLSTLQLDCFEQRTPREAV